MRYCAPRGLAWVSHEAGEGAAISLYLMHLPDGIPLVLTGTAALIWLLAIDGEDVPAALAEAVADPPPDLVETTNAYLEDLVVRGLLVREDPA